MHTCLPYSEKLLLSLVWQPKTDGWPWVFRGHLAGAQAHSSDVQAERIHSASNGPPNNDGTMTDGNYLKSVRNGHKFANCPFPSPTCVPAEEKAREIETLGSV